MAPLRSRMLQEPEIEGPEHEDDSHVHGQSRPELMPEEQDVNTDHHGRHREHVKHDGQIFSHGLQSSLDPPAVVIP
jgi:hypothetical protein